MKGMILVLWPFLTTLAFALETDAGRLADTYADGIRKVNVQHAKDPGKTQERDLAAHLPREARLSLDRLLDMNDPETVYPALIACGEAALDLDLMEDFEKVRRRLEDESRDHARQLGTALSRPRFILRGLGGLQQAYLEEFAEVMEAVLAAYDEVFGFAEWSKVPGKKLRVRIHYEAKDARPPHFAPEFPFHSEIDLPVTDPWTFKSPTVDGRMEFYGLCHELGHVIAMWGDPDHEEDHHAWAHYTGVTIVEHVSKGGGQEFLRNLRDVRWRSLSIETERLKGRGPSLEDRDGVEALFLGLHRGVGPRAIGDAINHLDRLDRRRRVNRVRYYTFGELKEGLLATLKPPAARAAVEELMTGR